MPFERPLGTGGTGGIFANRPYAVGTAVVIADLSPRGSSVGSRNEHGRAIFSRASVQRPALEAALRRATRVRDMVVLKDGKLAPGPLSIDRPWLFLVPFAGFLPAANRVHFSMLNLIVEAKFLVQRI